MTDTTNVPAVKPVSETTNKVNVALRYLGSNITGGMTVFVMLGVLTPEQQVDILKNAHAMYDATYAFVGAAANIWYIVFPIAAVYLGKLGIDASGFGAMIGRVFAAAKAGNQEAKVAIVNAAASPELGTKAIINPELAPSPATPGNVVVNATAAAQVAAQQP
jgi:hypothetical protein